MLPPRSLDRIASLLFSDVISLPVVMFLLLIYETASTAAYPRRGASSFVCLMCQYPLS